MSTSSSTKRKSSIETKNTSCYIPVEDTVSINTTNADERRVDNIVSTRLMKKRQRISEAQQNQVSRIVLVSTTNSAEHEDVVANHLLQENTKIGTIRALSIMYMMLQNIDNVAYQFCGIYILLRCHLEERFMPAIADSIISIMKWHSNNIHLQIVCLDLLYLLTTYSQELRVMIASNEHHDLTYILNLMEKESSNNNRHLQQIVLGILSLIAEDEHGRNAIFEEEGMARIISSLLLHIDDPLVQCNGSAVLCWLVHSNEYQQQLQGQSQRLTVELTDFLLEQLSKHMNDSSIFGKFLPTTFCF